LVKDRFGASVSSNILCFLHLRKKGASVPSRSTSTPNAIKIANEPVFAGLAGMVAAAAGTLSGADVVVAAGVVAAAAGVLAVSVGIMPESRAGVLVAAAAGVAASFRPADAGFA
jgi:hypothetical protein